MDLFSGLSDDQTALIGCVAALSACAGLLALTSVFGRRRPDPAPNEAATLRFPDQAGNRRPASAQAEAMPKRRAA
jgi:hypothetical protein